MKKKSLWISLALVTASSLVWAQPSEEVAPLNVQEMSEEEKRLFLPSDTQSPAVNAPTNLDDEAVEIQAVEIPNIPVAEPETPAEVRVITNVPAVTEVKVIEDTDDGTLKNFKLSPSFAIRPVGFYDMEGARRFYFGAGPSLNFGTAFKTDSGNKIDFSLGYSLFWKEYMDKEVLLRDFTNAGNLSLGGNLNDRLSLEFGTGFEHFYIAGTESNGSENYLDLFGGPTMNLQANDKMSFSLAYMFYYSNALDSRVDFSDLRGGDLVSSDFGDFVGGQSTDFVEGGSPIDGLEEFGIATDGETQYLAFSWFTPGMTWKPVDGTTLKLAYQFQLRGSNNESLKNTGHIIDARISQDMPWDGGNFSFRNQLRFQIANSSTVAGTDVLSRDVRNRSFFSLSQEVVSGLSMELFWRLQLSASNGDDYAEVVDRHQFYLGTSYSF